MNQDEALAFLNPTQGNQLDTPIQQESMSPDEKGTQLAPQLSSTGMSQEDALAFLGVNQQQQKAPIPDSSYLNSQIPAAQLPASDPNNLTSNYTQSVPQPTPQASQGMSKEDALAFLGASPSPTPEQSGKTINLPATSIQQQTQGVEPTESAKRPVGFLEAAGRGLIGGLAKTNELMAKGVGIFPYVEDKTLQAFGIDSNIYNRYMRAVHATGLGQPGVEAEAIKPTEELTTGGKIGLGLGEMGSQLPYMAMSGGVGAEEAAAQNAFQVVKPLMPRITESIQAMLPMAAQAGADAVEQSAQQGDNPIVQTAKGIAQATATAAIGVVPLSARSKIVNPLGRLLEQGAYGYITGLPIGEQQKVVDSWVNGKPYVPSEWKDMAIQAIPMAFMTGAFGVLHAPKAQAKIDAASGGPETTLTPSKNPVVNEREAKINAMADAQATVPEAPNPIKITPEPTAKPPAADLRSLIADQAMHDEGSPEYEAIQAQIDALNKPAEVKASPKRTEDALASKWSEMQSYPEGSPEREKAFQEYIDISSGKTKPAEATAEAQPTQPNAIQEPSATEAMLRPQITGQGEVVELPRVGEGNAKVPAQETKAQEVAPKYSTEVQAKLDEIDANVKLSKIIWKRQLDAGQLTNSEYQSRSKGLGMRTAAEKRQITGELTAKEQAAKDKREESNYKGKPVSVDGRNGTIIGNPFGRVKVRFSDGTESTHLPEKIQAPVEVKAPIEVKAPVEVKAQEIAPTEPAKPEEVTLTEKEQADKALLDKIDAEAGNPKAPKPKAKEVNPYSDILYRYENGEENAITSPSDLVKEVEKIAKRQRNQNLKDAITRYRDATDLGADVEPEVERLLNEVKREADRYKSPLSEKAKRIKTAKDKAIEVFGDAANNLNYVLENKILDPAQYRKRVKAGLMKKGGEYDFFDKAKLPKKVRDLIFSRDGSPIDEVAGIMRKTPYELLEAIQEAYIAKEKLDKDNLAKEKYEEEKVKNALKMEQLKRTNPEEYDRIVEEDARNFLNSKLKREGGSIEELPEIVKWADKTIKEGRKRLNIGLDPELLFAYAVKSAHFLGVRTNDFARWSKQMVKKFGEQIQPHLENIWGRVRQHASGEYNLIDDPFWEKNSGTPKKGEEAYTPSKIAWSDAARDMLGVNIHPSELPSLDDVNNISKWPESLRDLATVNDVSYKLNQATDVAGNEVLDIVTTPMEEEGGTLTERLGDFGGASFRNRLRKDIQKRNDAIERIKEKTKGLYTDEEILERASELPNAGRIYAEDIFARSKEGRSRLENWADKTIKESKKRLNVGLDPEVLSAYAVKGAFKIARGVRDFSEWSKQMVQDFGEAIRPHLEDLWSQAKQIHSEREKYASKPLTDKEAFAKKVADAFTKGKMEPVTEEELGNVLAKKFPNITPSEISDLHAMATGKEKPPAPYAGVSAGEEGQGETPEQISIRKKDQAEQVKRGILTSVIDTAQGLSDEKLIERGRQNLANGVDPNQALEKARQGDAESLSTARAHFDTVLAPRVSELLKTKGPKSPEYIKASREATEYYRGIREGLSVASEALRTAKRQVDLTDASSIAREYTIQTGEEPTLSQHDQIRKVADKVDKTIKESDKASDDHKVVMDGGLAEVDVQIPTSVEEGRQQVADLSNAQGKKAKEEIDRLNNELEQTKRDLEEIKQAKATGQDAESLKAYYEAKLKDVQGQLESQPKYGKEVFEQAKKIVDKWKADAVEAEKLLRKQLNQMGSSPDPTIILTLARIMRAHIGELALDFAKSSARLIEKFGPKIEPFLKDAWAKAQELIKGENGGEKAVKSVRKAVPKSKPVEKMTPAEKASDSLRKRIAQAQKKIDDLNSGKITTPKEIEKVTNEEIQRLESEYNQKKKELADARLKSKQRELFEKGKVGDELNPEQIKTLWESAKRFYLDKGESDYDKMISDLGSDFGLTPDQIRKGFATPKGAKKASDEMYIKQRNRQMALDEAKRWLDNQKASWIGKIFGAVAEKTFKLAILGHGTAFIGTHAPQTLYTHSRLAFKAWLKGLSYSFTGKDGRIQNIVDNKDLINRPNWIAARKGGLENDPREIRREGATPARSDSVLAKALDTISGGRGFDALFHLRQDMFDQAWEQLSITQRTPEMAEMFANKINNATGFTKGGKTSASILQSPITKVLFFAPKLIASRFKWLIQDPARMIGTFGKMANPFVKVSPEERMSAVYEAKNKAKFLGVLTGTLLANQALLSVTGSNQGINFTDPKKNDWLSYKGFGYNFATVGAFTRIARLLASEYNAVFGDLSRWQKAKGGREQAMKDSLYTYLRSGLSPITRDIIVAATRKDYVGNTVPWSSEQPDRGRRKLTYREVIQEQFAPIPISEAATQKEILPAVAKAGSAALLGARLETPADIEEYKKSLESRQSPSSSNNPFGLKSSSAKPFGLKSSTAKPFGLK